jgi:hypothetical protein
MLIIVITGLPPEWIFKSASLNTVFLESLDGVMLDIIFYMNASNQIARIGSSIEIIFLFE